MKALFDIPAIETQKMLSNSIFNNQGGLLALASNLHKSEISPSEIIDNCFKKIHIGNPTLNCFVNLGTNQAEERAKQMANDRGQKSLLWGLPISVKDLTPTQGIITTYSSRAFANFIPNRDAPLVSAMKAAGLIIVGKTNTPEFGILPVTESELNGVCKNPWNLEKSSGGSSGGGAVSVAAGLTDIAHGSDGAGSLRIPASSCGIFTVTLPPGRLPPSERLTLGRGSQDGVFSRTVADALYYLAGMNAISTEEFLKTLKIATSNELENITLTCSPPINCPVDLESESAAHKAAELLSLSNCKVLNKTIDWFSDSILTDMMLLRSVIPVSYGDPAKDLMDRTTIHALELSEKTSAIELQRTYLRLQNYGQKILSQIAPEEIILTPILAKTSVDNKWITEPKDPMEIFMRSASFAPFTAFANITGLCAVSVPIDWTKKGMPIGVQLVAHPHNLPRILGLAARLERVVQWGNKFPKHFYGNNNLVA